MSSQTPTRSRHGQLHKSTTPHSHASFAKQLQPTSEGSNDDDDKSWIFCMILLGMARSAVFPLAPAVGGVVLKVLSQAPPIIGTTTNQTSVITAATTSSPAFTTPSAWNYGLMVLCFHVGSWLGSRLIRQGGALPSPLLELLHHQPARQGALAIALLVGTFWMLLKGIGAQDDDGQAETTTTRWWFWLGWLRFGTALVLAVLMGKCANNNAKKEKAPPLPPSTSSRKQSVSSSESASSPTATSLSFHCFMGGVVASLVLQVLIAQQQNNNSSRKSSSMGTLLAVVVVLAVVSEWILRRCEIFGTSPFGEVAHHQPSTLLMHHNNNNMATPPMTTRQRLDTTDTNDFFDCQSALSSNSQDHHFMDVSGHGGGGSAVRRVSFQHQHQPPDDFDEVDPHEGERCVYQNKRCIYPSDSSPAFVPAGECASQIPANYWQFYGQRNHAAASKAWQATQAWRQEHGVWSIHTRPNVWFPQIKQAYPHFLHGHSQQGYPIVYEQPGRMELKQLFRSGCHIEDMVFHYRFLLEYISNVVSARPELQRLRQQNNDGGWGLCVVMDVKGAGLSHLSGDVLAYLKQAGDINSAHYPLSMKRAFLVNSPFWLAGAWSGLKGILPASVQVEILSSSSSYLPAMEAFGIALDQIPPEYGGSSPYALGQHPYEQGLYKLVDEAAAWKEDDEDDDKKPAEQEPQPEGTRVEQTSSGNVEVQKEEQEADTVVPTVIHANVKDKKTNGDDIGDGDDKYLRKTSSLSPSPPSSPTNHATTKATSSRNRGGHYSPKEIAAAVSVVRARASGAAAPSSPYVMSKSHTLSSPQPPPGSADFGLVSRVLDGLTRTTQTSLEVSIPLWMMTATPSCKDRDEKSNNNGVLGLSPSAATAVMLGCCLAMVVFWRRTTHGHRNNKWEMLLRAFPLRAFRLGMGLQSFCLALMVVLTTRVDVCDGTDEGGEELWLLILLALLLGGTAWSNALGQWASSVLFNQNFQKVSLGTASTTSAGMVGDVVAVIATVATWSWATDPSNGKAGRPVPFNGTCCVFCISLVAICLYISSFAMVAPQHANSKRPDSQQTAQQCFGEAMAVTTADVAFLLNSSPPQLALDDGMAANRSRSLSSNSVGAMERGEEQNRLSDGYNPVRKERMRKAK